MNTAYVRTFPDFPVYSAEQALGSFQKVLTRPGLSSHQTYCLHFAFWNSGSYSRVFPGTRS